MTRSFITCIVVYWVFAMGGMAYAGVQGYYRFPAIHGDTIVFAAEGDLWKLPTTGGLAIRLTTHAGNELFAKISPDGKWIAFSGEYQGNRDVYVMPSNGGRPRRLTFHPRRDEVIAWRPDSRTIVFRTNRYGFAWSRYSLFEVPVEGGQPGEIQIGPAALADFSSDGKFIAFNRFSREFRNWKRYYGGRAQDIWIGKLTTHEFEKVTDWKGTDRFPMWYDGKVYFASDRNATMNLYRMNPDGTEVEAVTQHKNYDVRWPDMDGPRIVYMLGGDLWLVDVRSGQTGPIAIDLPSDQVRQQPRFEDATKTLESYVLDHKGKTIALSSRGEIWVTRTKKGRRVQLTRSSGVRERAPAFSPDGKHIAVISDQSGEQEVALIETTGKSPPDIITHRKKGWLFGPVWSPTGEHIAYADLTMSLFLLHVETKQVQLVDRSTAKEIRQYAFSPDGKWLAYTKEEENRFGSIYLYSLSDKRSFPVTTPFSEDRSPAWDPEGKYLYFLSERSFNPLHGVLDYQYILTRASKPHAVILAQDGKSPFLPEELLETDDEVSKKDKEDTDKGDPSDKSKLPEVRVDPDGIQSRVVEFPVDPGYYRRLQAVKGKVFYLKRPMKGRRGTFVKDAKNALMVYDFKKRKSKVYIRKLRNYTLSGNGKRIAYRFKDKIRVADIRDKLPKEKGKSDKEKNKETIKPADFSLHVTPSEEWAQIFHEAWRLQRDFYWADNLAGVDWAAVKEKYKVLLPRISTRDELNDLIGQMFAELGTSHTYVWGGDRQRAKRINVGLLGAMVEFDPASGRHRFVKVLRPEVWETDVKAPLTMSHANIKTGDYLFAIEGQTLTPQDNIYQRLANLAEAQVMLTVGTDSSGQETRDVQVETLKSEKRLLLRDWVRRNREYVDQKSDGRIGYVHLPNMGGQGLVEFSKAFYPQINKEGLIIDVRYNGGGNVSQLVIDRLRRTLWAYMTPRRGLPYTYPARVHIGHKVVVTNQNAGSDGDIFPESFQVLKLGPVIGMRSWGGVVGIRRDKPFIDGGMSSQPEFAWWHQAKGWNLENQGVTPDIEIDILPSDWRDGRDPQLDRAIEELERMIREEPVKHPPTPPIPDKSKG